MSHQQSDAARHAGRAQKVGVGQQAVSTQQPDEALPGEALPGEVPFGGVASTKQSASTAPDEAAPREASFGAGTHDVSRLQRGGGVIRAASVQEHASREASGNQGIDSLGAADEGAASQDVDVQDVDVQDVASREDLDQVQEDEIQPGESQEVQISEIEQIRRERDEYLDLARRTQADYENYRKRMMRQQVEASIRSVQELALKLLPVLDAFSIAQVHLGGNSEIDPHTKALMQSGSMLSDLLASEGLERIDQVGVAFDPFVHDAIEHVASQPGTATVVEVLRAGYRWKDKVLRPAMVRVEG